MDLVDEVASMNVVMNNRLFPYYYTCIHPMEAILYKFMMVVCPRQIGVDYKIAYAMDDLEAQKTIHFDIRRHHT